MALQILKTGVSITTSGASAGSLLATDSSGAVATYVRIVATAAAYVRLGTGAQTAVATDMIVQPGDSIVLATAGSTHAAALQVASAGVVQISPVEGL